MPQEDWALVSDKKSQHQSEGNPVDWYPAQAKGVELVAPQEQGHQVEAVEVLDKRMLETFGVLEGELKNPQSVAKRKLTAAEGG